MKKVQSLLVRYSRYIGLVGTALSILAIILRPSWPSPDKILVFLTFVFMAFGNAVALLRRLGPFVATLLVYESFRGIAPHLNSHVEYDWMISVDRFIGGGTLPTQWLQSHLSRGGPSWYDFGLYLVYMLHFVLPIAVALLIWRHRVEMYWRYVFTFVVVSFMGFITFVAMPAAPPWMAARDGHIPQIRRVADEVWTRIGLKDFPTVYKAISPNPVAAVPSLHAAYATLFAIFIRKTFGRKWGLVALIYPLLIYFGTVYEGEHYLIDEIIGSIYAFVAYGTMLRGYPWVRKHVLSLRRRIRFI